MTDTMPTPPEPTPIRDPDPHMAAALAEEQRLLDEMIQAAQTQYLLNRVVELNAAARRATES